MKMEIMYPGPFAALKVDLENGESVKAEAGAMITMSETLDVEGKLEGGIMGGLARKFLTGETLFFQNVKANRGPGEVIMASAYPGEIAIIPMDGSTDFLLQKDGFLAAEDGVQLQTKMQNLAKGIFSGEGFFISRVTGKGNLVISSYGAIHNISLKPGETHIVDNAHLVAWTADTEYSIEKASKGWISSFTSGEGLVCRFRGPGEVLIQTRNPGGFGAWLNGLLPRK